MSKPAPPDWAAVRVRYETTDDPVAQICADAAIDRRDLAREVRRGGWRRQKPRPFPPLRRAAPGESNPAGRSVAGEARPERPAGSPAGGTRSGRKSKPDPARPASPPAPAEGMGVSGRRRSSRHASASDAAGTQPVAVAKAPSAEPAGPATGKAAPLTPAARRRLLDRLVAAISLKLEQLEHRMAQDFARTLDGDAQADAATATDHERETRAIGALIDNLGKITEIEGGLDRTAGKSPAASDLAGDADRWRRELADRLQRLVGTAGSGA